MDYDPALSEYVVVEDPWVPVDKPLEESSFKPLQASLQASATSTSLQALQESSPTSLQVSPTSTSLQASSAKIQHSPWLSKDASQSTSAAPASQSDDEFAVPAVCPDNHTATPKNQFKCTMCGLVKSHLSSNKMRCIPCAEFAAYQADPKNYFPSFDNRRYKWLLLWLIVLAFCSNEWMDAII